MRRLIVAGAALIMMTAFHAHVFASVSGSYSAKDSFFDGSLRVTEIGGRINFTLHTITKLTDQIYVGEVEGTAPLTHHVAVFRGEQGCMLTIRFEGKKAIVGGGTSCRYYIGSNGNFDGIYYRKNVKR